LRVVLAAAYLAAAAGCTTIREIPTADAVHLGSLKGATVRTRTGEVYYFDRARVAADTLSGLAQERRSVFLAGGDVQEVTEEHQVYVALADIEQLTVAQRDWKRAGLWALVIGGGAGAIGVAAAQNSGNSATQGGGFGTKPGDPNP
jgi:hypothetical protein